MVLQSEGGCLKTKPSSKTIFHIPAEYYASKGFEHFEGLLTGRNDGIS